jgi:hypothetical protein
MTKIDERFQPPAQFCGPSQVAATVGLLFLVMQLATAILIISD